MRHAMGAGQAVPTVNPRNYAQTTPMQTRGQYLLAAASAAHLSCGEEANRRAPEATSWELFCDRGQRKPRSQVGDIKGGGGGGRRRGGWPSSRPTARQGPVRRRRRRCAVGLGGGESGPAKAGGRGVGFGEGRGEVGLGACL